MEIVYHICLGSHDSGFFLRCFFSSFFLYTNKKVNHFCSVAIVCASLPFYSCLRSQGIQTVMYSIEIKPPKKKQSACVAYTYTHTHCSTHFILNFEFWMVTQHKAVNIKRDLFGSLYVCLFAYISFSNSCIKNHQKYRNKNKINDGNDNEKLNETIECQKRRREKTRVN